MIKLGLCVCFLMCCWVCGCFVFCGIFGVGVEEEVFDVLLLWFLGASVRRACTCEACVKWVCVGVK